MTGRPAGRVAAASRWLELVTLFVILPLALFPLRAVVGRWVIPVLLAACAGCLLVLLGDRSFDRRRLWNADGLRAGLRRILTVFLPGAAALAAATALLAPELLLRLPRERPTLWVLVLVLYPLLSVYPQEVIFRTFFFHRYGALLGDRRLTVAASAASFALAHVFLSGWIAPVLSGAGGVLFARTYARSGSTLQACVEHSLWGDLVFTLGLGWYFYGGAVAG